MAITRLLPLLLLVGCHIESQPDPKDQLKRMECVKENGWYTERFVYRGKDVRLAHGIGQESVITVTDEAGWTRTMTLSEVSKWKCRELK